MLRTFSKHLTTGLVAALLPVAAVYAGEVSLTGEGSVKYTPDSARLQFTASAEHNLPAKATQRVNELMDQWREGIRDYRDQLDDYSDATLNLYSRSLPIQERGQQLEKRAVASQTVSFTIHDLNLLNPLLAQAQDLGLDYHLGPHQFYHSDESGLEQQALALAIDDARERCDFVAKRLGKQCGEVKNININGGHRPMPMMMAESRAADAAVSEVGPRELTASVSATFELE